MFFALLVPDSGDTGPRDRLADGIAIVLALAYGSVMVVLGDAADPGAFLPLPADVAAGVAAAAALLVRRRHPLGVTVALLPLGAISVMATGPILIALFTAAIRLPARVPILLGALNVATAGLYFLLHDRPAADIWVDFAMRGVVTAAALGWGLFTQAYRRLTASLRDQAARLESEQQLRADQARLTERARIAREMHDVLAHRMSLISLHAGALEVRGTVSAEELSIAAGAIRTGAHDALDELRAVVGVARTRPEPPQPGLGDLPELVAGVREAGMSVDFTSVVPADGPPVVLGRTAYRIIQEGLTNAHRHGSGPAASVRVRGAAGHGLRITIINPLGGTGGAAAPRDGLGLIGIAERVALAGGTVRFGPEREEFRLEAELPWPA
ncbi:putative two-component system sensor kinase [Actinoplanes missouriensis 431]|uniref:histidine kinase n=1 Tax=Actinoplanes missouriensis (strain ATCC 14538 / DSM 43046 / CBS 188.64 / JCM 3121 / NBRC 102363 / NCIMB 12654 / NRRL B-3342 / UNCC 431) TaxID=512565 RepID=I0HC67_ACTM4|nr:histidine kinase [Actinoplanes missouriensis]BAL90604.1 putative two-component system sensor kinase [Actinoplanes missouriensis 431]